jgi:hypothetical protein
MLPPVTAKTTTSARWARRGAVLAALTLLGGCDDKAGDAAAKPSSAPPKTDAPKTDTPKTAAQAATATTPPKPSEPPAPDGPAKTYDCGAKDQKPCPMQGWMKRVMAPASASGDPDGLSKALAYVADHAPPGFPEWTAIANAGAAKAAAGNVDDAKASCKRCHDAYKDRYKSTLRDRPF